MQFRKKYTDEELNKIYNDFIESKLSKYAFVKNHKIGSSTFYKAIYLNEKKQEYLQKDKVQPLKKDESDIELKLYIDKKLSNYHLDTLKSLRAEINSQTHSLSFKYALLLLASQFGFTIILLFFLS